MLLQKNHLFHIFIFWYVRQLCVPRCTCLGALLRGFKMWPAAYDQQFKVWTNFLYLAIALWSAGQFGVHLDLAPRGGYLLLLIWFFLSPAFLSSSCWLLLIVLALFITCQSICVSLLREPRHRNPHISVLAPWSFSCFGQSVEFCGVCQAS